MDPSRGDSRYNLNYSMNSIGLSLADQADLYGNPAATAALISRPPSSGLLQPMIGGGGGGGAGRNSAGLGQMSNSNQCQTLNNTSAGQQQARGIKRTSSDCYEDQQQQQQQQQIHRSSNPSGMTTLQGLESVGGGGGAGGNGTNSGQADVSEESYTSLANKKSPPANGKKTKGRVKIKMEYIDNKLRRYTTFSKRKTGIMKKAYELSTLTGTQVMLLVASETGHVYTFATRKLQPMITSEAGKQLIQTCLNSPDPPNVGSGGDQRMSATGFEETELSYNIADEDSKDGRFPMSSGNETDDSSDVESPGPGPSTVNQSALVEDTPKPMVYYDNFKVTPSTSHQAQQQHHHQHQAHQPQQQPSTSSQNTSSSSQLSQNLSPEVLLSLVQAGHLPQDVLLKLVQSGDLHLHTEEGGQYITIPIPVASTSSKATSSNKGNTNRKGGGGNSGSSTFIKKETSD